jgi:hypothetical protein
LLSLATLNHSQPAAAAITHRLLLRASNGE